MDAATSTVLTAGIVAFVGLATTWLNNYFTANRETKQWDKQQNAEKDKRRHEEEKAELNRRREMFQNALTQLSNIMTFGDEESISKEEQRKLIAEAQKSLNLLSVSYRIDPTEKSGFHSTLEDFIGNPTYHAGDMREAVVSLYMTDNLLFPDTAGLTNAKQIESKTQEPLIHFAMQIDDDFRREHVINTGIELPRPVNFTYPLSKLTQHQRELLADIYFAQHKKIPTAVNLPMPTPNSPDGGRWQGKINPTKDNYTEVLKLWEQDYRDAQNKLNKPTES